MPAKNKDGQKRVVCIGVGDIHLTLQTPACRMEEDWLRLQGSYLDQLKHIAEGLPIVCSGDIFDRWNPAPELIEFALRHLPDGMLCVPGQHDLPNHRIDLMHKSGYGVLKTAGKIADLSDQESKPNYSLPHNWEVCGFGWNQDIRHAPDNCEDMNWLLVAHKYVWCKDNKYPDAPVEANVGALVKTLKSYRSAIFGDNHKGFLTKVQDCAVLNNGTFIRRKADEQTYRPQIGALLEDGTWKQVLLDTTGDKFVPEAKDRPEITFDMREFLAELNWLGDEGLDFKEVVVKHLRSDQDLNEETKNIIMEAVNGNIDGREISKA